jgi:hypothetical protein
MLAISQNFRSKKAVENLSETTIQSVYQWELADFYLYSHFRGKIFEKIQKFGEKKMRDEVEKLKIAVAKEMNRCEFAETIDRVGMDKRLQPIGWNVKVYEPSAKMMKDERCFLIAINQLAFTDMMRSAHVQRLKNEKCDEPRSNLQT